MIDVPFQAGAPLAPNSPVYISRVSDREALFHLQKMHYITLVEPRQQGKTSLIQWLDAQLKQAGYTFAYADLSPFDNISSVEWYQSLCEWLLAQIQFIPNTNRPQLPSNGNTWLKFLRDLAEQAEAAHTNLVLVLDEVGVTPAGWATGFFSAIRSVYNHRQHVPCFNHLTFIVAGAYNPRELIRDPNISNFNVDHRISLNDFNIAQIEQLVSFLSPGENTSVVANQIHFWTSGQPYICQRLCLYLSEHSDPITSSTVDIMVDKFFREDTNHLTRIFTDLRSEPKLFDYARRIIKERPKFSPSVNEWHFRLAHVIGIISSQEDLCTIRNRMYERALTEIEKLTSPDPVIDSPSLQLPHPDQPERLPDNHARLRQLITEYFNESELNSLCFDMNINYQILSGQDISDKARELVAHCKRHGRIAKLIAMCRQLRPHVDWPEGL